MLPRGSSITTCGVRLLASTYFTMSISMSKKAADFCEPLSREQQHRDQDSHQLCPADNIHTGRSAGRMAGRRFLLSVKPNPRADYRSNRVILPQLGDAP